MRTRVRGSFNKVIGFALMVMVLLSFAARGESASIPGGLNLDHKPGAMFAVILGTPAGMDKPTKVIASHFSEQNESNYSFYLIPLRDGIHISIENIYSHDMHFSELPYMIRDKFTAKLGEYYLVNAFKEPEPLPYTCVRIVAQDDSEQAAFLLDPTEYGESGEFIISPSKIPDGLNDSKTRLLSGMAAGAVWQYGKELGWVDSLGLSSTHITPRQLALSQSAYQKTLYNIIENIDYGHLEEPLYSGKAEQYAAALFPGVKMNELPETDEITNRDDQLFTWMETAHILLSAPSADGKTGYVVVGISYENENGAFDDFYRVDWKADEPFDVYRPFQYRLIGVQPMERFLLGGAGVEELTDKYLGSESAAALKKFGITHSLGHIDKPGAWGSGSTLLLKTKTIDADGNEGTVTYILLDDGEDRITYLAYSIF